MGSIWVCIKPQKQYIWSAALSDANANASAADTDAATADVPECIWQPSPPADAHAPATYARYFTTRSMSSYFEW